MAWEQRSGTKSKYFYKSFRSAGKVKKLYCGSGSPGQIAAEIEARRRAEIKAAKESQRRERARLLAVLEFSSIWEEQCGLIRDAALLTAGFHRVKRCPWRKWHDARKAYGDAQPQHTQTRPAQDRARGTS